MGVQEPWEKELIQGPVLPLHQRKAGGLTHTDFVMVMSRTHVRWGFEVGPTRQRGGRGRSKRGMSCAFLVGWGPRRS